MKAVLEFNLPEDQAEFQMASRASEMALSLEAIRQLLRHQVKYEKLEPEVYNFLCELEHNILSEFPEDLLQ